MATEKRLIAFDDIFPNRCFYVNAEDPMKSLDELINRINNAPTVDAVPIGVLDQVRWERDVAMQQLEEHGIPFGGIAPDVVKVVRCKDCKHYDKTTLGNNRDRRMCTKFLGLTIPNPDDFCSYGERKDNG